MVRFRAERLIYGKLIGTDREHMVVGQSVHWPSEGGVPKCVGSPGDSNLTGACSLDWHPCGIESLLALSWCEPGPRITSRDFYQVHHLVARPDAFAQALPFLPDIVAQMRDIPTFDRVNHALPPFVLDYPALINFSTAEEAWFCCHWNGLAAILTALLSTQSVFIHSNASIEENLKIITNLMRILPSHLRAQLTFSTDDYARRPYRRSVTFSHNNRADVTIDWQTCLTSKLSDSTIHPVVANLGMILTKDGLTELLAQTCRMEYGQLSVDDPQRADLIWVDRFLDATV